MSEDDPFRTVRDVFEPVTEELAAAGFEDAEEIGRGGFGVVYRCTQAELDRTVAVKILTAELDAENRERFFREQRAMGQLTGHPNIVTMLQAGSTASGRPYLVMPYHPSGSLDARICEQGPLPVETLLWIGVKIAGALESAHRLGTVHRDVKPGNILLTDYGEPALTDFGIARIAGGFQTATGTVTGSPAFTAPEVLEGEAPTAAADVYGLGATLFCALTGHAVFERRSGENVVTQFLRITTQPVPDLREHGIAEDVSAVVSAAMARDPHERPSAAALGEAIRQAQRRHGFSVEEMAIHVAEPARERGDRKPATHGWRPPAAAKSRGVGSLPLDLTSFIDRRTELAEVKNLLSSVPVLTLTGIGGVGKTRLALRAAATARRDFADGVWLVELADVSDPSLLVSVVAAALGLRDPARPLREVMVEFLATRETLLVLDNCEQLVAAVAELVETWLRACPHLRILATSREPLDIAGEAVLQVSPLTVPDPDREPSLHGLPRYDAVTLFIDRATALVPGFELSEENKSAVVRICARLDGLPLAIELAAARMRTMSPEQILQRLNDRYALLTRGSRTAPTRQQTLRWCVDWSYQLCTPAEQRLWARLSVFAGGFELDAAEQICGADLAPDDPLDVLSSLVDKSIVIRDESNGVVRFRMLETVRDYGRQKLRESGEEQLVRRRHRDWYQQLALAAEAGWISDRQPYWTARLEREQPNLRDALEYCLAEDTDEAAEAGLRTASALSPFWNFRGLHGEGRRWIDRTLAHPQAHSIPDRVMTLHSGTVLATTQGDLESAAALVEQARALAEQAPTPMTQALATYADGVLALYSGDLARASSSLERAIDVFSSNRQGYLYVVVSAMLGQLHALHGDTERAIEYHEQVLSITEACGESLFRSISLLGKGFAVWQQGRPQRAQQLLEQALRVNRRMRSPFVTALGIELLAWTVDATGDAERAAVLMGAAAELSRFVGSVASFVPGSPHFHDECDRSARADLGAHRFDMASRRGRAMGMDEAVAYALGEQPTDTTAAPGPGGALTKRERQVAELIAQGLTNKQIATKLVISPRTADGHVEHILTKLGFTSRAQIAAWITKHTERQNH
ncbi:protein kinase [Nocardia sp. NBC_00565]|uniref:protein kinase domain-containing protein n=1 Tax=Nocardia sp. NBC_00565 TaxID=2975993 RepID=UPI002E805092|nr:protein kinase [Nocardia sp. NBC_00565]WUC07530.1 protein kinase [Nocardia sp. NBC_00565]